jgi:hypothetical protein
MAALTPPKPSVLSASSVFPGNKKRLRHQVRRRSFGLIRHASLGAGGDERLSVCQPVSLLTRLSAPNCVRSPTDVLFRSTTDDSHSSNAPVRRSNPAGERRPQGCDRLCRGWLCPALLQPFRSRAGTSLCCRRAPAVPLQTIEAPPLPQPPLLSFQSFDSRLSPLFIFSLFFSFSMAAPETRWIL